MNSWQNNVLLVISMLYKNWPNAAQLNNAISFLEYLIAERGL